MGFDQTIVEINVKSGDVKRSIIYRTRKQISIALKAKCTGRFNIGEIVGLKVFESRTKRNGRQKKKKNDKRSHNTIVNRNNL